MDNGIYTILSRQLGLFRDMEVTANNIANATTTGYSAEHMLFRSYLVKDRQGRKTEFTQDISTYRDTGGGSLRVTGNPLDVALKGNGYFMVETPLGERYTRAGSFQVDGAGVLITAEGYPVLDTAGQRIVFEEDDIEIVIGEIGNIKVDGEERGILGIVEFENEQLLERTSSSLYKSDAEPAAAQNARLMHGVLEDSNVQPVVEMTHMIDVSRAVSSTARTIEVMYELQRKASNTFARQG